MKFKLKKAAALCAAMLMTCNAGQTLFPANAAYGEGGNGVGIMEYLDRGIYAVKSGNGMFVSWRWNADDADDAEFRLYRDDTLIYTSTSGKATSYQDNGGNANSKYRVDTVEDGEVTGSQECKFTSGTQYFDIALKKPGNQYSANDCCVGDVDGDGQYEIFLKWEGASKDNSQDGVTDLVYIDCYTLEGDMLWRVNLGKHIRAGQHYTQLCVADFDCDGKAELITKTADGTVDGQGNVIGDPNVNYVTSAGRILEGPEFITLFDGMTGAALDTIDFPVPRGKISDWGDGYANRCDRFISGIAYLDGVHPSAIYGRGYYTRLTWSAFDVVDKKLSVRWIFDTGNDSKAAGYGCGNHQVMVADVDNDGKQEILTGSNCIDDDGTLKWTTGLHHGDAMHVAKFFPDREGVQVWMCHEESPWGCSLIDGETGKIIFHQDGSKDTGRCCAGNIWAGNNGSEFWGAHSGDMFDGAGNKIAGIRPAMNFLIYWDGDLEREILDYGDVQKMTAANKTEKFFVADGCSANNGTKAVPCLTADLFGDWREELLMRTNDSTALRVWCTNNTTDYRITTLMHDMQYRAQDCCEQSSYNQPPHTSFYLGSDAALPQRPSVKLNNTGAEYTPPVPVVISGKYIENLIIKDTANKSGWKIAEQTANVGSKVFGDREYTYTELPQNLIGAEILETACGSKNTDAQLAEFTAAEKIDTYVLLDTRVETAPDWLSGWTKTGMTAKTDNAVTFSVYTKSFENGETVTLGTNGMSGNVVNYTVMVQPFAEDKTVKGDVNADGTFNVSDVVMLQKWLLAVPDTHLADWKAADLCEDNRLDVFDLCMMKRLLLES